jgi:hypothetical protein
MAQQDEGHGQESSEVTVRRELRKQVASVLGAELGWVTKEDTLVRLLREALRKIGQFYRTDSGSALFFRAQNRRLYEITDRAESDFGRVLTYLADRSVKIAAMRRAIDRLQASVGEEATLVTVHALAYNSPEASVIAVNDFGGGMWYRERGGQWTWKPNASEGILFWSPPEYVEPWKPDFARGLEIGADVLDWFIGLPHFTEDALTVQDQRLLLRASLLAPLFPSRNMTRAIAVHLGSAQQRQYDTGKTMAGKLIGVFWAGEKFQPTPVKRQEKGEEDVQLALMHHPYVLLDNVDTDIGWLNDMLCTYATGARPMKRKLYEDTKMVSVEYRGRLCLTSRSAKFNREDVASRTIPFRFCPINPDERKTEAELIGPVLTRRNALWGTVLSQAGMVQDALPDLRPPHLEGRMADFISFGWCVSAVRGEHEQWEGLAPRLALAQAGFALDEEPLFYAIQELIQDSDLPEQPTQGLWDQVRGVADRLHLPRPGDAASCTRRLHQIKELLEARLDIRIEERILHGKTLISINRGPTWQDHQPEIELDEVTEVTVG